MTNKRTRHTFEFDEMDAPILMHAFAIAATTAWMCGSPKAREKLAAFRDLMKKLVPEEANFFSEEHWCEIGMALAQAKEFLVTIENPRWERDKPFNSYAGGYVTVKIGDLRWSGDRKMNRIKPGAPEVRAVFDVLERLAPVGCEGMYNDLANKVICNG